jgi:hypothetical protein
MQNSVDEDVQREMQIACSVCEFHHLRSVSCRGRIIKGSCGVVITLLGNFVLRKRDHSLVCRINIRPTKWAEVRNSSVFLWVIFLEDSISFVPAGE